MDVVTDSDYVEFLTPEERAQLLGLLETFFERWEHFHRVCGSNNRSATGPAGEAYQEALKQAAESLTEQANKVRAFYG
jgi:hypothetical protein